MAQDWAISFYKSRAWLHNRAAYMQHLVDTSGHIVYEAEDGFHRDDGGYDIKVLPDAVVPPGMCERCFSMGMLVPAKVVHHIEHITPENVNDPHVTLNFDNFQRLCQDCHAAVHRREEGPRWAFDDNGNLVSREDRWMTT